MANNLSEAPETGWTKTFQDRAARFGWSTVSAASVYSVFDEIVPPDCRGFERVRQGALVKPVVPDIFHLLSFGGGKSGVYSFRWGVSLSYVPHDWSSKCKFHRTLKSARFDLFEDAGEVLVKDPSSGEGWNYLVDTLHGASCFREDMARAWGNLKPVVESWFGTMMTLDGVFERSRAHAARKWRGFRHLPDPRLVHAFTLARLGKMTEARSALGELAASSPEEYAAGVLTEAVARVSQNDAKAA